MQALWRVLTADLPTRGNGTLIDGVAMTLTGMRLALGSVALLAASVFAPSVHGQPAALSPNGAVGANPANPTPAMLRLRDADPNNLSASLEDAKQACADGWAVACVGAAGLTLRFASNTPDITKVRGYFERACALGNASGCSFLGDSLWMRDQHVPLDPAAARAAFARGCSLDNAAACGALGAMQYKGEGGPVDRAQSDLNVARALKANPDDPVALAVRTLQQQEAQQSSTPGTPPAAAAQYAQPLPMDVNMLEPLYEFAPAISSMSFYSNMPRVVGDGLQEMYLVLMFHAYSKVELGPRTDMVAQVVRLNCNARTFQVRGGMAYRDGQPLGTLPSEVSAMTTPGSVSDQLLSQWCDNKPLPRYAGGVSQVRRSIPIAP